MCNSCPFNCTDESDYAQNMGCLPDRKDIIKLKDQTVHNWACHSNPKRKCQGLAEHRDINTGGLYLQPGSNYPQKSWHPDDLKPIIIQHEQLIHRTQRQAV